jgi:NodT family efflux transporter outer membrane factor (OMF) lipoprotein
MKKLAIATLCAMSAALTGCAATGPRVTPPAMLEVGTLAGVSAEGHVPQVADNWWAAFGDAQLDALVSEALEHSPTITSARSRIAAADALSVVARAARLPETTAQGSVERELLTAKVYPPPFGGATVNLGQIGIDFRYELDVVGRTAARIRLAESTGRAARADLAAARLSLASSVVRAYLQLARNEARAGIIGDALARRAELLDLVTQRHDAGIDSQSDVDEVQAGVSQLAAQSAALTQEHALLLNELAVLVARGPGSMDRLLKPNLSTLAMPDVPPTLPADLVARRPDVLADRERVVAAATDVRLAEDAFYPNIDLTAFAGFESLDMGSLISSAARQWGVGPAISLPLFDVGRLRGQLGTKDAAYSEAVARYDASVLGAFREVADAVVSLNHLKDEQSANEAVLAAVDHAYVLSLSRFKAGLTDYLGVLRAKDRLLEQQRVMVDLEERRAELVVALIRALGGGFAA